MLYYRCCDRLQAIRPCPSWDNPERDQKPTRASAGWWLLFFCHGPLPKPRVVSHIGDQRSCPHRKISVKTYINGTCTNVCKTPASRGSPAQWHQRLRPLQVQRAKGVAGSAYHLIKTFVSFNIEQHVLRKISRGGVSPSSTDSTNFSL